MKLPSIRVGIGYDVHAWTADRKLILGGIEIPHTMGLAGHSDADVLLHAIIDALLGAAALGDIGRHFPDSDPAYKNIDSAILLKKSIELVLHEGFELNNLDCTLLLEQPPIAPHIPKILKKLSQLFWCQMSQISVKATTSEGLGFIGRGEGAAALAIVSLRPRKAK